MRPGAVVANRFRLERQLGTGGMGAVWAATHLLTGKAVALKFLHKKNDDAEARRRVLREARATCAVHHPNVVAVHDVVEDEDGTPILVMDLLHCESLAAKLARERVLSPDEAVRIITPVLSALAAAHEVGVVHRDLKPDNIFLIDTLASHVKILDFGVAKLLALNAAAMDTTRLTDTGAMIGTPHYMAPEQAFGESDVDARADLWAVGAVLYECLSGSTPTSGQNLGQILKALASGTITPLEVRAPDVQPALAAVVDGLLQVERDDRPKSAKLVLEQLASIGPLRDTLESRATPSLIPPATSVVEPDTQRLGGRRGPKAALAAMFIAAAAGLTGLRLHAPSSVVSTNAVAPEASASPAISALVMAAPPMTLASSAPLFSTSVPPSKRITRAKPVAPKIRSHDPDPASPSAKSSGGTPLITEPTF